MGGEIASCRSKMEYLIQAKQLDCVSFPSASVHHSDPKMSKARGIGGCVAFSVTLGWSSWQSEMIRMITEVCKHNNVQKNSALLVTWAIFAGKAVFVVAFSPHESRFLWWWERTISLMFSVLSTPHFLSVWSVQVGGRCCRQKRQVIPDDVRHLLSPLAPPMSNSLQTCSRNDKKDKSWIERGGGFTLFLPPSRPDSIACDHRKQGSDQVLAAGADRFAAVSVLSFPITPGGLGLYLCCWFN